MTEKEFTKIYAKLKEASPDDLVAVINASLEQIHIKTDKKEKTSIKKRIDLFMMD